jgi:hypothetical protein
VNRIAEATVGSELERYLRVLQVVGMTPVRPWSIREFSLRELEQLAPSTRDPWGLAETDAERSSHRERLYVIRPELQAIYNSTFPFGMNDGPVWAGKGFTSSVHGGFAARYGPLSAALDPIFFAAQNAGFDLLDNRLTGSQRFADGQQPYYIDLPQRFGDSPYSRFNLGNSYARLDVLGFSAGVSTASQWWGPAIASPLLLGNNAGGFPHVFVGTSSPLNIGIGRVHTRVEIGRLDQSAWSTVRPDSGRRLMAGAIVAFSPRGAAGLEVGAARFFHRRWRGGLALDDFRIPFQGFTSGTIDYSEKYDPANPAYDPENQLVSAFARWVLPRSGFEMYGEYMRNDRNFDLRDALLEPDHDAAYTLGFQRAWTDSARRRIVVARGEVTNAEYSHLSRVRVQSWPYTHAPIAQGHTELGQALGSYLVERGGGGTVLGLDLYQPTGRIGVSLMRVVRGIPETVGVQTGTRDVIYGVSAEGVRAWRRLELFGRLSLMNNINRNFSADRANLGLSTGVRAVR